VPQKKKEKENSSVIPSWHEAKISCNLFGTGRGKKRHHS
jgi:hypothetical protein